LGARSCALITRSSWFTIDATLGNVLDGRVVVDLAAVEPAILARYMGRAEADAFRSSVGA
jgi:hypothetical protein